MTRDDLLKNKWPPYPHFPELWLSPTDWVCGKLDEVSQDHLVLQGLGSHRVEPGPDHSLLGPSWPLPLLKAGDVIALKANGDGRFLGPYLLSPHLLNDKIISRSEWQNFLTAVQSHLVAQGFRSWVTPFLVKSSGVDAHIDFMTVQGVRTGRQFALPTSPEFELKKAIASGERKIFEIKSCFRDDDESPIHRTEFTMLEWYRAYEDKWSLVADFENLVESLSPLFGQKQKIQVQKYSMSELFEKHLQFPLRPDTPISDLKKALSERGQHFTDQDDWDDLFFRLYIEFIEPQLDGDQPLAIYNFPASQSSLSRKTQDGWADRFEIYWRGVELANAYQEQNNPHLVSQVVDSEINKRQNLGRKPPTMDESFMRAMQSGFPPCAGAAMGLDRLFMVLRRDQTLTS